MSLSSHLRDFAAILGERKEVVQRLRISPVLLEMKLKGPHVKGFHRDHLLR